MIIIIIACVCSFLPHHIDKIIKKFNHQGFETEMSTDFFTISQPFDSEWWLRISALDGSKFVEVGLLSIPVYMLGY